MPISGDQQIDKNALRYSLPLDSCVGDAGPTPQEVAVISKSGPKASAANMAAPSGGNPYIGGKSAGKAGAQGGSVPTVMSGPDLPNDHDTDDPDRA